MNKEQLYKCVSISGGGNEYNQGTWKIKILSERQVIIEKISEHTIYSNYEKGDTLKLLRYTELNAGKNWKNPTRWWNDESWLQKHYPTQMYLLSDSFTVYPDKCGTPYLFELIGIDVLK